MTLHAPRGLVVTADVRSRLADTHVLIEGLAEARTRSVVADAGGFFGPNGYYQLGGGSLERTLLERFYDILCPSTFGFRHYLEDPQLRGKTVCANILGPDGQLLFKPYHAVDLAGASTAITGVVSRAEFEMIPAGERIGLRWTSPGPVLNAFGRRRPGPGLLRRALVVLGCVSQAESVSLARQCPAITAIVARPEPDVGHRPLTLNKTLIVAAPKRESGYAVLQRSGGGWAAHSATFPPPTRRMRPSLTGLHARIAQTTSALSTPVGMTRPEWTSAPPSRRELVDQVARHILNYTRGVDAAVLNESVLAPRPLGLQVTRGAVLETAPGDVRLVLVDLDADTAAKLPNLALLHFGPTLGLTRPGATGRLQVVTTAEIAHAVLGTSGHEIGGLIDHVIPVLTAQGGRSANRRSATRPEDVDTEPDASRARR